MSTKLFNGYYIDLCSLHDLHKFSLKLREKMLETEKEIYAKLLVNLMVHIYDKRNLIKAGFYELPKEKNPDDIDYEQKNSAYFDAFCYIGTRFEKTRSSMKRDVDYDLSCNVTVIPTKTKILALIYAEQSEYYKVFESFKNVHKYPYWNNTDRPDDMAHEEWEARGKEWDNAMKPMDIPAMAGFTIDCISMFLPYIDKEELFSRYPIPEFEDRLKRYAISILSNRFFTKVQKGDTIPITNVMHHVSEWIKYKESTEGKEELEKVTEEIRSHLKNPLTIDDLFKDPEELK